MAANHAFRVNAPAVIREVFEDEAVLVHLESGNYYSLNGTGASVLQWIEGGLSREGVIARARQSWNADDAAIEHAVAALIDELVQERLIVPDGIARDPIDDAAAGASGPFTAPALSRYTDMQDLLLLDPIHDVDETGWPARPAGSGAP